MNCEPTNLIRRVSQAKAESGASACALDYQYNESGFCACQHQACVPLNSSKTTKKKQLLVIGDSISNGYFGALQKLLADPFELVHAPGNNGNTNWGR